MFTKKAKNKKSTTKNCYKEKNTETKQNCKTKRDVKSRDFFFAVGRKQGTK